MITKRTLIFAVVSLLGQQLVAQSTIASNILTGTAPNPTQFLGSSNAYDIVFKTSGVEKMRLLSSSGNFGIGIATPATRLHVAGDGLFSTILAPTSAAYIKNNTVFSTASTPDYTWFSNLTTGIFHPATNIIGFSIAGGEKLRINSNGFIGMGTTTPQVRAHINGDLFVTGSGGAYPFGNPVGIAGGSQIYLGDTDTQPQWAIEYDDANITTGSIAGGINFWRPAGSFGTGGNYVLFLKNDSRVGIHTNNPTADLTVNGNMLVGDPSAVNLPTGYKLFVQTGILTEKLRVSVVNSATWADYVFDKNYKLKTINEVESFIIANKHLPGVLSASEVEKAGVDMIEMDSKLLEKIEELTLYIIEQNKRIELLEKKLQSVK